MCVDAEPLRLPSLPLHEWSDREEDYEMLHQDSGGGVLMVIDYRLYHAVLDAKKAHAADVR